MKFAVSRLTYAPFCIRINTLFWKEQSNSLKRKKCIYKFYEKQVTAFLSFHYASDLCEVTVLIISILKSLLIPAIWLVSDVMSSV